MIDDPVSEQVIGACIEVHRHLGPGLLEGIYEDCVCHELALRGVAHVRQLVVPAQYKGLELQSVYRLDLVVEDRIIVELKSVDVVLPAQARHSPFHQEHPQFCGSPSDLQSSNLPVRSAPRARAKRT